MKPSFLNTNLFVLILAFGLVSCSDKEDATPLPAATNNTVVPVPFFTRTADGMLPSAADQLLFEARTGGPILAPDGHQLTWGEFASVGGSASVQCQGEGVEATLNLTGLIPNGVYTIWNIVFDAPGMDPSDAMLGLDGLGAAGLGDGSDNYFTASASGTASLTFYSPGGPLSMLSNTDLGDCPLTDNFEWHIVGAYHLDNQTYGPLLGPDGTVAEQFGFIFRNDQ